MDHWSRKPRIPTFFKSWISVSLQLVFSIFTTTHRKVLLTELGVDHEDPLQNSQRQIRLVRMQKVSRTLGEREQQQHHQQARDAAGGHEHTPRCVLEGSALFSKVEDLFRDDEIRYAWNMQRGSRYTRIQYSWDWKAFITLHEL